MGNKKVTTRNMFPVTTNGDESQTEETNAPDNTNEEKESNGLKMKTKLLFA